MRLLEKYSIGIGDRFGREGKAQIAALQLAREAEVDVVPVWNKSNREHQIIGSEPIEVRVSADRSVAETGWNGSYYVDADHITLGVVDRFIPSSDYFTIDVAEFIGKSASEESISEFTREVRPYIGRLDIPGASAPLVLEEADARRAAEKFLLGVEEAGRIYKHIHEEKGDDEFVTEISIDETDHPQSPAELFLILAMIAFESIPIQTIAPKFTGRFNKGVDYVGDINRFREEFEADLAVLRFAVQEFHLPESLKLSVHSGSDKFSLYRPIGESIRAWDAGLHLKTAGTTWLEELAGLATAGTDGLAIVKEIHRSAAARFEELCGPYSAVLDIDKNALPSPEEFDSWTGPEIAQALRHNPANGRYNPNLRQLLHVSFKVAAEMGDRFTSALDQRREAIEPHVTENLYDRHIRKIFVDSD